MRIAYCDCFSGISGDMFLGALLDAGLPFNHLKDQVATLNLPEGVELHLGRARKGALDAAQFHVTVQHDPDHHRHLSDIVALIGASGLSPRARDTTLAIFRKLAEAEAAVHGTTVDEVHFHEVGAIDSIVDIAGAAIGLEYLGIERLYASALPMVSGQVETQHGLLPLPAPATLRLMMMARAPVTPSTARVELVTPTGAAILAALAAFEQPAMTVSGLGIGCGQRDLPWPNVMRLIVGDAEATPAPDLVLLETNIDDMNPQAFGYIMSRLFDAGARDVYFTPIQMKKNRPATMLSAIALRADEARLARLMLAETTTLGVRVTPIRRYEAGRDMRAVRTGYGEVPVKVKWLDGGIVQAAPEYDVCARLAAEKRVPLMQVYNAALAAAQALLSE